LVQKVLYPRTSGMARSRIAARLLALALAGMVGCFLNPQPEPPESDSLGRGGSATTTGTGGAGGSAINGDRDGGIVGPGGNAGQSGQGGMSFDAAAPPDAGAADARADAPVEGGEEDAREGAADATSDIEAGPEDGSAPDAGND